MRVIGELCSVQKQSPSPYEMHGLVDGSTCVDEERHTVRSRGDHSPAGLEGVGERRGARGWDSEGRQFRWKNLDSLGEWQGAELGTNPEQTDHKIWEDPG